MILDKIGQEKLINSIQSFIERSQENKERMNGMLDLKLGKVDIENDTIEFLFEAKEWCKNPYGGVHGGVICSIFDTAMGTGALAIVNKFVTTTDLNVNYLRPMSGERYRLEVEYTLVGKKLIRTQGKAYDAETGKLCATAMAGFMIIEGQTAGLRD